MQDVSQEGLKTKWRDFENNRKKRKLEKKITEREKPCMRSGAPTTTFAMDTFGKRTDQPLLLGYAPRSKTS